MWGVSGEEASRSHLLGMMEVGGSMSLPLGMVCRSEGASRTRQSDKVGAGTPLSS
jgi:hypothetical protein